VRRVGSGAGLLHLDTDGAWRNHGERVLASNGPLWPRKETTTAMSSGPATNQAASDQAAGTQPASEPAAASQATSQPAAAAPASAPAAPAAEPISIDDFMKVELRVARVLAAEAVPKSKKLLKLLVDTGADQRTIVAGIAEAYAPESLVGRTIAIVFNLKPAKLMGIESNGMVLAASVDGGKPQLVSFDEPPPPGARVR
jgi:methionyl-tRNA synthetase